MAHIHSIYDTDPHFVIDPKTRKIKNDSGKVILVQGDHNSERFTFEIPRYVDGHDMSLSDVVEIHYNNTGSDDEEIYSDVEEVSDLQVSPASNDVVIFSWLISGNATRYKGSLTFAISFQCHDAEGNIDYELGTLTFEEITIGGRLRNSKGVIERVADILSTWRTKLFGISATEEAKMRAVSQEEQNAIAAKGADVLATIPADYTAVSAMAEEAIRTKADGIVVSAEGESVVVNDSSDDYIRGLRVFGRSTQKSTTGAQLIPFPYHNGTETINGVAFVVNEDGSVTTKGTSTTGINYYFARGLTLPAGTYTISYSGDFVGARLNVYDFTESVLLAAIADGTTSITFTTTKEYTDVGIYLNTAYVDKVFSGTIRPMLNSGSTVLSYEPYTGGKASPSPEYPQEIVNVENPTIAIHSKNLIPFPYPMFACSNTDELDVTVRDDGGVLINGTPTQDSFINLCKYDFGPNHISPSTASGFVVNKYNSGIWVAYDGKNKISFILVKSGTVCNNVIVYPQVEVGAVATEYEKGCDRQSFGIDRALYAIPVTSGGNYTDENGQQWICDEVDFERGVYVQRINRVTFDGSENWGLYDFQSTYSGFSLHNALDEEHSRSPGMSNQFHNFKQSVDDGIWVGVGNMSLYAISKEWYGKGLDAWKTHLRENPLVVYYPRITPIETSLSESELEVFRALRTNKLTTTVLNDAGAHLQLDYVADTKTYIDNQIAKRIAEITNA